MKKVAAVLIILSVFSVIGYAQLDINLGVKGGLNHSTFSGNSNWITQYAVGGFVEFRFAAISIQPEIFYSVKGNKVEEDNSTFIGTTSTLINYTIVHTNTVAYFDIPLLVKFHLRLPDVRTSLFIGPSLGFLISANDHTEGFGSTTNTDNKSAFTKKDLCLVFGAGIDIPLDFFNLTLDARYDFGLSTLDPNGNLRVFNRVLSIYAGIAF